MEELIFNILKERPENIVLSTLLRKCLCINFLVSHLMSQTPMVNFILSELSPAEKEELLALKIRREMKELNMKRGVIEELEHSVK